MRKQSILSRFTPYSRQVDDVYTGLLRCSVVVQSEYQSRDNLNAIQIALDFFSDNCQWSYVGDTQLGDFQPENLGTSKDITSYSKVKRFESSTVSTTHKIRSSADGAYPNGFYPNIIYIGGHNLHALDSVVFRAYQDDTFTTVAYEQKIFSSFDDIFHVNGQQFSKYKYYELEFTLQEAREIKVGRIILAGSLPTNHTHNAQNQITAGWKDHKDEMITESKTRLFNRQFWAKKLSFQIKINLEDAYKLADQIQKLIIEGTGSRPFLVVLNPKDPQYRSLYGVLTSETTFEHDQKKYGYYDFDIEEIQ